MNIFASFWAHSTLPEERWHVKLKKMARSRKNLPFSVAKNHEAHSKVHKIARLSSEYIWANQANPSSIAMRKLEERTHGRLEFKVKKRPVYRILSHHLFDQLQDIYAVDYVWFNTILKGYRSTRAKGSMLAVADYNSTTTKATAEQKDFFKNMPTKVVVMSHLVC